MKSSTRVIAEDRSSVRRRWDAPSFIVRAVLGAILMSAVHGCGPSQSARSKIPPDADSRDSGSLASGDGGAGNQGQDTALQSGDAEAGGTAGTDGAGNDTVGVGAADGEAARSSEVGVGDGLQGGGDRPVEGGESVGTDGGAGAAGGSDGPAGPEDGPGGTGGSDGSVEASPDGYDSAGGWLGMDAGHDGDDGGGGLPARDGAIDAAEGGGSAARDGAGDEGDGGDASGGKDSAGDVGDSTGRDSAGDKGDGGGAGEVNRGDGATEVGGNCCGCLCRDPTWSCSGDTCVDPLGRALTTAAEAGFFELAGGNYVSEGQARVSPGQRIWYSFQPATSSPASKPLAVFFNGGPGAATSSYLFSFNTGPWTLDPAATGTAQIAANANSWAQFANLLYIDAPGTGFSYPMSLDGGAQPSVGIDLDHEAAAVIRVIVRFLDRHIALQSNPVILVGESYGGTRATLMLDRLFNYQLLAATGATYQDAALYTDLLQHFAAVFPQEDTHKLSPQQIAAQFGHQVLIEPVVAGQAQWSLNQPDRSVCVANYDIFQCDQPSGWSDQATQVAADHLTTIATLRQVLGVDPTTIEWLHATARTRAYGRGSGIVVSAPEMTATFGMLGADDNYFLIRNYLAGYRYSSDSRWWTDATIGESFLNDVLYAKTFITNARLDMDVWAPAIPVALGQYPSLVSSSVHDTAARTGFVRAGWIQISYLPSVAPDSTNREIRFPFYPTAGHTVTMRAPGELLTDVMQWYSNISPSPGPHSGPPAPTADWLPGTSSLRNSGPARLRSDPDPYMGP
jgi:hypothetical protein